MYTAVRMAGSIKKRGWSQQTSNHMKKMMRSYAIYNLLCGTTMHSYAYNKYYESAVI